MIPENIPLQSQELFDLAMRHSSASEGIVVNSYERLEFYGDAVLGLIIAQYLYEHHPDWDQGMMSKARSSVVQEAPLAECAANLQLNQFLVLGPGEEATSGRDRPSILCDLFEAVVGAIYIESGLERARWFVLEQLNSHLIRINEGDLNPHDHKSKLQEIAQAMWRKTPVYKVVSEKGYQHEKRFTIQVIFDEEVIGEGCGRSKKEAEQSAAKEAIEAIERSQRAREYQNY